MKYVVFVSIALLLVIFGGLNFITDSIKEKQPLENTATVYAVSTSTSEVNQIKIKDKVLNVEIRDNDTERHQGLSGRDGLKDDEGMLFVFENQGIYGFWMKDMKFSIDIAWIDGNKKIIHIEQAVSPLSYPKSFYSPNPALYVLETRANWFADSKIEIGDFAEF